MKRDFNFFIFYSTFYFFLASSLLSADRPAEVAGSFYPADKKELTQMVEGFLDKARPPALNGRLLGLLVPHAGYTFSGNVAATGYKAIGNSWTTVILLGPSHRVPIKGAAIWSEGSFETPLGPVPVDRELSKKLMAACPLIKFDPLAHQGEHSIEAQLPFLQRVLGEFKIVPILMNDEKNVAALRKIGHALAQTVQGRTVLIVISSDLSHYPSKETADLVDRTTLASLASLDPDFVMNTSLLLLQRGENELVCTMCGEAAVFVGLTALKELGMNRSELLRYANSGDIPNIGDITRVVGYGAVAFEKAAAPATFHYSLTEEDKKSLLKDARNSIRDGLDGVSFSPAGLSPSAVLNYPVAVFVTLVEEGRLRGCIGTTEPRTTLRDGVRYFARAAAFEDPRFSPLNANEIDRVRIEVSVLSQPRPVAGADFITPGRDGVVVRKGNKTGLFLPTVWEQLPKKEDFLSEVCAQKAGLPRDCWKDPKVQLSVFTGETFEDPK